MLANIVGNVDFNSAMVLVAAFICTCIITTAMIVKRRSRVDVSNEFELAKIKQQDERDKSLFALETERGFRFKQIEAGLITSHRQE